jgi:hypothetical protein
VTGNAKGRDVIDAASCHAAMLPVEEEGCVETKSEGEVSIEVV